MNKFQRKYFSLLMLIFLVACTGASKSEEPALNDSEQDTDTRTDSESEPAGTDTDIPADSDTLPDSESETENWTYLFDGTNLDSWDTYLGVPWPVVLELGISDPAVPIDSSNHIGLNNDTYGVFTIVDLDGENVLRISGEVYGALTSKEEFGNYHIRLQFKWGNIKWPPRLDKIYDSGLLYHCTAPDGIAYNAWMASNEFQIAEGEIGAYYPIGNVINWIPATRDNTSTYVYDPNGALTTFDSSNWLCKSNEDHEIPDDWNQIDLYSLDTKSIHVVNGHVVNVLEYSHYLDTDGYRVSLNKGKIQIQSEGGEVFFRNISIRPIAELPEF